MANINAYGIYHNTSLEYDHRRKKPSVKQNRKKIKRSYKNNDSSIFYFIVGLFCVFFLFTHESENKNSKKGKYVTTMIDTKWSMVPLVLEMAEYMAEENPYSLWLFVDSISQLNPALSELDNDQIKYQIALSKAGLLLSNSKLRLLKFSLSMHIYSPRIEMYAQMAADRGVQCSTSVEIDGELVCSIEELKKVLQRISVEGSKHLCETYHIDHHHPSSKNRSNIAILYGELGTSEFASYHTVLKQYAQEGSIDYVLRHFVKEKSEQKVRLSGYGVELHMKSTEYKAEDDSVVKDKNDINRNEDEEDISEIEGFDFKRLIELYPDRKLDLLKFRTHLSEVSGELAPLKAWQFQELSLQAAQRIVSGPPQDAVQTFIHIAQNFPTQARSLANVKVSKELRDEVSKNQDSFSMGLNLQPTDTVLLLNGMYFDIDITDMSTILDSATQELSIMEGLYSIGITDKKAISSMLALDFGSVKGKSYAVDIRDSAIQWINDLETDATYKRWPSSVDDLLRPTFPGMLRSIRRNLYNLVIVCNPASKSSWPLLKLTDSFLNHQSPLRVGIVFNVSPKPAIGLNDASVAILNAYNYIVEQTSKPLAAFNFITNMYTSISEDRDVIVDDVLNEFKKQYPKAIIDEIFGEDSDYDTAQILAKEYIAKTGFRKLPQVLLNGVPLQEKSLVEEDFEEAVLVELVTQTQTLQKAVYKRELTDTDNVVDWLMTQPNVMPRLNSRVLNTDSSKNLQLSDKHEFVLKSMNYITFAKKSSINPITHWIVGDFSKLSTFKLIKNTFEHLKSDSESRIGVIPNPSSNDGHIIKINKIVFEAFKQEDKLNILVKHLSQAINVNKNHIEVINSLPEEIHFDVSKIDIQLYRNFAFEALNFENGQCGVITNGRILGPFDEDEDFLTDDFALLEQHTLKGSVNKILNILKESDVMDITSDMIMKASALISSRSQTKNRHSIPDVSTKHSVIKLTANNEDEPVFEINVIVDPVSRGAQKVGSIISVLSRVLNANINIYFNCVDKNSDMPVKSFYRFVLEPEVIFDKSGHLSPDPIAKFSNMPTSPLLTQILHVPDNWLVESIESPYDLDNIRLEDVEMGVYSRYELEYLLLEGHCYDSVNMNPPRGLQMTLGTKSNPVVVDTIVMANLGYFQMKANPGAWMLRLRQGPSADIYDIISHEGSDRSPNSMDIKVLISSFRSHIIKVKVAKKPGKQSLNVLGDDDAENKGLWNSITSSFSSGSPDKSTDETINIFSVASGHLYERFLRIMMLSVLKNTKSPVKFWFLKNYLSPTVKNFLPIMAQEYKFQYELVEYKWPRWLHQQTEKQRTIWGYKILFLDVLFPLDVKKIIFVDADQVVRADMKELVDLDLGGAPYAYTPFCESRKEMDGFRFWKQGYWKTHLQGRRYHISALYVVDLKRFRKVAAGDRLRGQYQALSQDPNSLSNLDQDLPNNMIHQVSIKSLPQEWLWCETWCDDASKKSAKTIDLCNNPLTKEAKLTAAMRIVSEWKDYDNEIKRLQIKQSEHEDEVFNVDTQSKGPEVHTEL
ncbi:UDP-glucose:glycoprotein glucosyltransferase [Acyrthosiphon pisum]|uniref:UDP-glucose:glycoprotein glucosyltransferase n=1 Tax=Acyrthosiphon pisum TaxID=7029 RepID=A0A8R2D4S2_ACYPI|nr:UDP-glucose:glycoprotein glucosyltransferase [Acyrthosiphon pisum]XP_016661451.1 UDP-glucose:glycoprotein glucosyltransferase [Acyrthosiphon pisum]|eukprot:XP_001944699.1 PREDICTED: UDP-glucose:glycoprotein glucosyltransferase [Acyrthosiphon pisum]